MVQLRIDGQEAAIKKGTNFQLTFENSYFAKGNTWSFDIELPLDDQRNAAIFGAINRHDVRQKPQTHTAELIVPGMNHIVGSVVVTKVTETSVSIQLATTRDAIDTKVANRYIHEMDITKKNMTKLGIRYTDFPVCDTEGTTEVGNYKLQIQEKELVGNNSGILYYKFTKFWFYAQGYSVGVPWGVYHPYLYDVVMMLLKEAGYTVGTNALDTPMMRALVIVRATVRKSLCYHLPHWTFSEFITEVERFAGVHFIFNNTTKVVNIVPVAATLTGSTSGSTTDFSTAAYNTDVVVVDELTAEIDTDTASVEATDTSGNNNVGYDLLGDHSDKYERLSDEVLAQANIVECTYDEMIATHKQGGDNLKQLFLVDGKYYLPQPDGWSPFLCNRLHDIKTSDEADVELLRITPCAFTDWKFDAYEYTAHYEDSSVEMHTEADVTLPSVRVPVAEGPEKQYSAVGYLLDSILENDDEEDDTETPEETTVMRVAFVDDVAQPIWVQCRIHNSPGKLGGGFWQAKLPYTLPGLLQYDQDNFIDATLQGNDDVVTPAMNAINNRPYTLELTARSAAGSGTAQSIKRLLPDTTIEYTKRIIAHALPDVDKLFLIHGKRFICKSLTVEINEEGIVPLMEGTFYMFD